MAPPGSTLSPLSHRLFRTLWLASLAGNFGNAVQGVGAAWLMTSLDGRADRVAGHATSGPALQQNLVAVMEGKN